MLTAATDCSLAAPRRFSEADLIGHWRKLTPARKALLDGTGNYDTGPRGGIDGDIMPSLTDWPAYVANTFFSSPCKHRDRLMLVTELLSNGMTPMKLVEWLLADPTVLRSRSSVDDLKSLLKDWYTGALGTLCAHPDHHRGTKLRSYWDIENQMWAICHVSADFKKGDAVKLKDLDGNAYYYSPSAPYMDAIRMLEDAAPKKPRELF